MFVHVEVRDLSVHLQSGVCVRRDKYLSHGQSHRAHHSVFDLCQRCAFSATYVWFPPDSQTAVTGSESKRKFTPPSGGSAALHTNTHAHTAWSSSVLQPRPVAESQITVRPLSRCSAVFLKTRGGKEGKVRERQRNVFT